MHKLFSPETVDLNLNNSSAGFSTLIKLPGLLFVVVVVF